MADEAALPIDDGDGRRQAFFATLGLAEAFYTAAVQAGIAHATAATTPNDAAALPWAPYGTRNLTGRVRALAQDPRNPLVLYAGTAMGGVFVTRDGGDTWSRLGRPEDVFAVGAMALDPGNPNILYVGTGEHVVPHDLVGGPPVAVAGSDWAAAGIGFLRCDTAAAAVQFTTEVASWSGTVAAAQSAAAAAAVAIPLPAAVPMPNGAADFYSRIVVDPNTPGRCWIASGSGLWRREPGPPVTFVREQVPVPPPVLANPAASALGVVASDVVLAANPARPGTYRLHVAFSALGIFRGVYDPAAGGGVNWEGAPLAGGLPAPSSVAGGMTHDRIRLAVCRSFPDHVYAVVENGLTIATPDPRAIIDVFHSSDGGTRWRGGPAAAAANSAPSTVGDGAAVGSGGQPWAHLVLEVHPDNPALVVAGGINLALSRNFGQTWQRVIHWQEFDAGDRAQHGDQHAVLFDAVEPQRMWVGNDGGISVTPDATSGNPRTDRSWRKRSHGIAAAQFNDIAVNPSHPTMVGGGLQDNATYITYGGETWHSVGVADGGQMAFTINDPRTYIAPYQNTMTSSQVQAGSAMTPPGPGPLPMVQRRPVNPDLAPPNDFFAVLISFLGVNTLFVPIVTQHPTSPGSFMVGQAGNAIFTPDNGANFFFVGMAPATIGARNVSALAFGNRTNNAATDDRWIGTDARNAAANGMLVRITFAPPTVPPFSVVTPPGLKPFSLITRIAVHPADDNCVAVATATQDSNVAAGNPFPFRGQVFLSLDRGQNWADITGLVVVGAPPPPLLGVSPLPPSPITSLVFDPQPAAGAAQVLYAGTIAGVYVIRNLPPLRVPAAAGAVPAFEPRWSAFNARGTTAALPLTLVKDLALQTLPADGAAPAGTLEAVTRHRLIAATYGLGMHVCDITAYPGGLPAGGPRQRLYIRQTLVDAGLSYPRPTAATLNTAPAAGAPNQYGGDPRVPLLPAPLLFTDQDAFDIRIDNAPFQFFENTLDGVEFDEDLRTKPLLPGEANVVYVQVHSSGWDAVQPVTVHLYFAVAAGGVAPDLHAGFWGVHTQDTLPAPAAAPVAPAATWQRAGHAQTLSRIRANQPEVARFDWVPPAALAGGSVALLAVCTSDDDRLPAAPSEVMATLIRNERRAALRVVTAGALRPDLFVRDGPDDDGGAGGVAYGGRSPDIIVVEAAVADPATAFADLGDTRESDRVRGNAGNNVVYVRVHNRRPVDTAADVELFWALPHAPVSAVPGQAGPVFDASKWQVMASVDALNVNVPAGGTRLVRFDFNVAPAPEPDFPNALAFIAIVHSRDGADAAPTRVGLDTQAEFWSLFLERANANNAAVRAVRFA